MASKICILSMHMRLFGIDISYTCRCQDSLRRIKVNKHFRHRIISHTAFNPEVKVLGERPSLDQRAVVD